MKVLILHGQNPIMDEVGRCLALDGHEVKIFNSVITNSRDLIQEIKIFQPNFCLMNNFHFLDELKGEYKELESFLDDRQIPTASWVFESPENTGSFNFLNRWNKDPIPKNILIFISDSYFVDFFSEKGMKAIHLPLAIPSRLGEVQVADSLENNFHSSVSFIGTPYSSIETTCLDEVAIRNYFLDRFRNDFWNISYQVSDRKRSSEDYQQIDLEFFPTLLQFFSDFHNSSTSYRQALKNFLAIATDKLPYDCLQLMKLLKGRLSYVYSCFHHSIALRRLMDLNPEIYGGEKWKLFLSEYRGTARRLSDDELIACYRGSKSIFCETKFQFVNLVHDRPLAVLAVGGLPITDYRGDLEGMFELDEIAAYKSLEEAKDLIRHFDSHNSDRRRLIERGRARVLQDHTYENRSRQLMKSACEHFGLVA